jgi:putative ABC transport system permease protein
VSARKNNTEPNIKFWVKFLRWFCPPSLAEGIEGDLLEELENNLIAFGDKKAKRIFILQTLKFFRPGIILRNRFNLTLINTIMWRSYFTITWRNLLRSKGYSLINIFGLSLGISCFLLMINYVRFEFSFDNFHPNVDRTFRIDQTLIWNPDGGQFGSTGLPLAGLLINDYPEVEEATRINTPGDFIIRKDDAKGNVLSFIETNVFAADSNFFSFFGFKLKEGDPKTALHGINKVIISKEVAQKFFKDESALGKTLLLGEERVPLEITGVAEHQPENSHFHFNYLLSMYTNPNIKKFEWSWIWTQVVTYVRLKPGADPLELEKKLASVGEKVIKPSFERFGINFDDFVKGKGGWNFYLKPMTDIHLKSNDNRLGTVGNINYAYTFAAIGFFVLLIAAINFINLSTARGTTRAKEVGVKKTLGAVSRSLISQFQFESISITIFASLLGLLLVEILKTIISLITKVDIPFNLWADKELLILFPLLPLVIGVISGIYPSFYLTSFKPVNVLKGKLATGMGNSSIRNGLVVVQFIISITLIAGTLVVYQQIRFMGNQNLGFEKDHVLVINNVEKLGEHLESFRDEVIKYPGVTAAAITMDVPGRGRYEDIFTREGSDAKLPISQIKIDDNFFSLMNFELVSGRSFDENRPSDHNAVVINETTARLFGWEPEEAVGKEIIYPGNDYAHHEVIGVVKDFNFQSLKEKITPLLFGHIKSTMWGDMRSLAIKFQPEEVGSIINRIKMNWNQVLDDTPMEYTFLDQELDKQYKEEERLGGMFGVFSGLSIIIAVIGLVGLVSYSAEIRKKEIGIRKVFGASTSTLVVMMNRQYAKLIIIALFISIPIAWSLIDQWLSAFAYRVNVNPVVFFLSALIEITIALLSVGFLSLKAASLNPVRVLKDE